MDLVLVQEIREKPSSVKKGRLPAMDDLTMRLNKSLPTQPHPVRSVPGRTGS